MSNAVKIFLAFDASFWPEGLFDVVCANCFLPELWILSYPAPDSPRSSTNKETIFDPSVAARTKHVVTFFAAGNLADQLSVMPKDEVVEKALDQLDEMFGSEVRGDSIRRRPPSRCLLREGFRTPLLFFLRLLLRIKFHHAILMTPLLYTHVSLLFNPCRSSRSNVHFSPSSTEKIPLIYVKKNTGRSKTFPRTFDGVLRC